MISSTKSKSIRRFNKNIDIINTLLKNHTYHQYLNQFLKEDPYQTVLPHLLKSKNRIYQSIYKKLGAFPSLDYYVEERLKIRFMKSQLRVLIYPSFIFTLGIFMIIILNYLVIPYVSTYLPFEFDFISHLTLFYLGFVFGLILLAIGITVYFIIYVNFKKYTKYRNLYKYFYHTYLTYYLLAMTVFLHNHQLNFLDVLRTIKNSKGLLGFFYKQAYLELEKGIEFSKAYDFIDLSLLSYISMQKESFDYSYIKHYSILYGLKFKQKFNTFLILFKTWAFMQMGIVILMFYTITLSPLTNLEKIL